MENSGFQYRIDPKLNKQEMTELQLYYKCNFECWKDIYLNLVLAKFCIEINYNLINVNEKDLNKGNRNGNFSRYQIISNSFKIAIYYEISIFFIEECFNI